MQSAFTLALLGAVATANSDIGIGRGANGEVFLKYVAENNKMYMNREDFANHKAMWMKSTSAIRELRKSNPQAEWGLTVMSDRTDEEMKSYLGLSMEADESRRQLEDIEYFSAEPRELQSLGAIDWRTSGNLSAVKNQGGCGSCWVFNASVVLETMISVRDSAAAGSLIAPVRVSEQEGVDCVYGRDGCQGGWPTDYWAMTRSRSGAQFDSNYSYSGRYNGACLNQEGKTEANPRCATSGRISYSLSNVHAKLEMAPVSVALAAGNSVWSNYRGGIVTAAAGCPTRLDHAVVLVAFTPGQEVVIPAAEDSCRPKRNNEKKWCRDGRFDNGAGECCLAGSEERVEQQGAVWTIQNSWGNWGEAGFMRLEVTDGVGVCGMNNYMDFMTL